MASAICSSADARSVVGVWVGVGAGMDLGEDLLDPVLAGDRVLVDEGELRHALQPQSGADLPPQEYGRAAEREGARAPSLFVAEHRVEHARLLDIGADLHASQGDEADPWIVDLARQESRELGAN